MPEEMTLAEKIAAANRDIGPIKQGGSNTYQHYTFQTEADIKAAVQRVTSKYGFAIIPSFQVTKQYERQTRRGDTMIFYDVLGTFTITDGKSQLVGTMPGTGSDSGDKAVQKACTSAQKYFYKQLFNISDREDDPDTTNSKPGGGYVRRKPRKVVQPKPVASKPKKYTDEQLKIAKVEYQGKKILLFTVWSKAFRQADKDAQTWWKQHHQEGDPLRNLLVQFNEMAERMSKVKTNG